MLATAAETALRIGEHVIVDAAFLNREDRQHFHEMAQRLRVDFVIVDVHAEADELQQRLQRRNRDAGDASEAGEDVLHYQRDNADSLDAAELAWTIAVATDVDVDVDTVVEKIVKKRKLSS